MRTNVSLKTSITFYVLFAIGYFVLGWLLSTISFQSQIMPVWLPAGIALVGVYLWGLRFIPAVFLASFCFNFSVHPLPDSSAFFTSHGAELLVIAFGASLQAAVGACCLRVFGNPVSQASSINVIKFVLIVGLAVNLISANVGVWSLSAFNLEYSHENYWVDVLYWWLGDSLGVLLMTPFLLSFLDFRATNSEHKKSRWVVVSASLLLSCSILILTTFFINLSSDSLQKLTTKEVRNIENSFYRELNNSMSQLHNLASFIQSSSDLDREKFSDFVSSLMEGQGSIQAMSWNPIIFQKDKRQKEQELRDIYNEEILIRGAPIEEEDSIVYVKLISPEVNNMKAVGFNVFSKPARKQTLIASESSFQPKATPIINLVQTGANVPAYLMFFPVFKEGQLRRQLEGYATGVFLVEKMLKNALNMSDQKIFNYELYEEGSSTNFSSDTGSSELLLGGEKSLQHLSFELAGQTWFLNLVPDKAYIIKEKTRSYLLLFTLEVVIVTFIMLFILVMNSRQVELNRLVKNKTNSLNLALDDAEAANKAKSRFLANMSHEIRTPLNAVVGFTQLAYNGNDIDKVKGFIEKIKLSSEMLLNIVNDILDFSKIESGKLDISDEPFDIHVILNRIDSLFDAAAAEKSLSWCLSDEIPQGLHLRGDQIRLEQILINLCSNALKFTQEGSINVVARLVSQDEKTARIAISVKDTGIGIDKQTQAKLFNVFTQADDSTTRNFGGSGLGLAISKELSLLMNGDISINSELDKGAEFVFECQLPLAASVAEGQIVNVKEGTANTSVRKLSDLKILVAEDNKINQLLIQNILAQLGIEHIIAENGKQALLAIQLKQFDLILMDCQMPVLDGYEATRQIRNLPQFADLPVIALTADADTESREKALQIGFSDFLTKPIDIELLISTLEKYL